MSLRRGYVLLGVVLGACAASLPAIASSAISPTFEAVNEPGVGIYGAERHAWSPTQASVAAGGVVNISNPTEVNHGVEWVGGTPTPTCTSGVPVGITAAASGKKWSGTCTFTKPGVYTFYCTVHHAEMTGTVTVPGTPTAATSQPTAVTQTGATLGGTVDPEGNATSYYFKYDTTGGAEQRIPVSSQSVGSDFAGHQVSASLRSLLPNTEYHVELIAMYGTNSTAVGGGKVFTTLPLSAPAVTTGDATSVTETGATLNGTVGSGGQATSYFFKYGLTTSYEHVTSTQSAGSEGATQAVLAQVTGLSPKTLYHFRLVAENASGPSEGEDQTFTPVAPALPPPPAPPSTTTIPISNPTILPPAIPTSAPMIAPIAPVEPLVGSPLLGGPSLSSSQHGSSVNGSLEVSPSGAGGGLEVDLLATNASLAQVRRPGAGSVRVGRLVRASVSAGKLRFAVPLNAKAKAALRRHHHLALTVRIVLTPTNGAAVTITRGVLVHA